MHHTKHYDEILGVYSTEEKVTNAWKKATKGLTGSSGSEIFWIMRVLDE